LELKSRVSTTRSCKFWVICSAETCRSQNYMRRDKIGWRRKWGDNDARTQHQWCSPDLNIEFETWSNLRDRHLIKKSETQESTICGLCWYFSTNFQKILSRLRSCNFFEFLAFFLPALVVSYLQIQQTKNKLIYKSFPKPYLCRPRQDLKPSRLRLEKWEVSRPRPHLETPSLPNMQWGKQYSL